MTRPFAVLAAAAALLGGALAHDFRVDSIHIDHPWARATVSSTQAGAVYLTLTNDGSEPDRLLGARTPRAAEAMLHAHVMDAAGVMAMQHLDAVDLPAGGTAALQPGGMHVMLVGLTGRLTEGERFPLTLLFERAGPAEVTVHVEGIAAQPPAEHGHDGSHDHSH